MLALNYGAQVYIDSKEWFLQGHGYLVWVLPGISLLFSLFLVDNSKHIFSLSGEIVTLESAAELLVKKGNLNATIKVLNAIKIAKQVCAKANINYDDLRFFLNAKKGINAGNIGGSGNGIVMLDAGSIINLNDEQLAGVIAHELGHAVNSDSALGSLMRSLTSSFTVYFWLIVFVIGYFDGFWWSCGFLLAMTFIVPALRVSVSRDMERASDMYAVSLGYGKGLLEALAKIAIENKILNPLVDWLSHLGKDHPPLFERMRDVKKMLDNDQGLVKDETEASYWSLGKVLVLVGIGFYLSTKSWDTSTFLNVPTVYYLIAVWLYTLESFLSMSNHKHKSATSPDGIIVTIVGLFVVIFWYSLGIYANNEVLSNFAQIELLAKISLVTWLAKPLTLFFADKYATIHLVNQLGTYVNILTMALATTILILV